MVTSIFGLARRSPRRKKVGVIELIAYTVVSEWASLVGVPRLKRQLYSIMPQVVAVWCRELGHRVTYATYYGQQDPLLLLPDDLDIVFIAASTQASALAYALAKIYSGRGVMTVCGGPHAKSFPEDCARFFDVTVTHCDRELVADILDGHVIAPAIVESKRMPSSFPSVEARLRELRVAAFGGDRPTRTSVISLYGSVGCPYTCGFCTDWNSTFAPVPADQLAADLQFVSEHFPGTILGFHDPNFAVRFDETMTVLETAPMERRNPYAMQCSLSILTPERAHRLRDTNCFYIAPGIESWNEFGNKLRLSTTHGFDRVEHIAHKLISLNAYVPGLQANFVMGLDSDEGDLPFDLTREFIRRVPCVWHNINILTPYGATPVYDVLWREGRLLRTMPLALHCGPYLTLQLKNYEALEFYDKFITLLEASTALPLTIRRTLLPDGVAIKLARLAQTVAIRRDLREMRAIRGRASSRSAASGVPCRP